MKLAHHTAPASPSLRASAKSARGRIAPAAPRTKRTQAERRETTRRRLVEAAIDAIFEGGFYAATVQAISRGAGVTSGAFQYHFPGRAELLVEVIDALRERIDEEMGALDLAGRSLADRVALICEAYWRVFSGRHYIAAVQIQLGTMNHPPLVNAIARAIQEVELDLDARWLAAFPDVPRSPEELKAVRYVTLAAIRGLMIRQTHPGRKHWVEERKLLVEMVTGLLSARRRQSAARRSRASTKRASR